MTNLTENPPARRPNLFDEPFEKWWRDYAPLINTALEIGTRDAWKDVLAMAFVCGACFGSRHITEGTSRAEEIPDDEAATNR